MSSPGILFIVGMERCYTTSLAQWLVDGGLCDHLVHGIKEPALFVSDPAAGVARWERERHLHHRWLLDASVANVWSDGALDAIASIPEARVVICLRNQVDRMVSAYRLARALFCLPVDEALRHPGASLKYGDNARQTPEWADDLLSPLYLRKPITCRRAYTLIRYSEYPRELASDAQIEACDREVERLARQSLPVRVTFEWAQWIRHRTFPNPTILLNSYYAAALRRVLDRVEARRVMVLTLADHGVRTRLGERLPAFLSHPPLTHGLGRLMDSSSMGFTVSSEDIDRARKLVSGEFAKDSEQVDTMIRSTPALDLSLFESSELFSPSESSHRDVQP